VSFSLELPGLADAAGEVTEVRRAETELGPQPGFVEET